MHGRLQMEYYPMILDRDVFSENNFIKSTHTFSACKPLIGIQEGRSPEIWLGSVLYEADSSTIKQLLKTMRKLYLGRKRMYKFNNRVSERDSGLLTRFECVIGCIRLSATLHILTDTYRHSFPAAAPPSS